MAFNPFGSVPVQKKGRTNFDEAHSVSGTFPLSTMCPVFFTYTLPGDAWRVGVFNLTKLETLIAPAMQQVDASVLWFKMPARLLFKHYKKWYSGGENGEDNHQKPHVHLFSIVKSIKTALSALNAAEMLEFTERFFGPGSLWNYFGLACPLEYDTLTGVWKVLSVSSWGNPAEGDSDFIDLLPFMGYQYLYDSYFRDQTLSDSFFNGSEDGNFVITRGFTWKTSNGKIVYFGPEESAPEDADVELYTSGNDLSEGGEVTTPADFLCLLQLFNRSWRKDYYTSALPTPQRGPEVKLSLVGDAPVEITDGQSVVIGNPNNDGTGQPVFMTDSPVVGDATAQLQQQDSNKNFLYSDDDGQTVFNITGKLQGKDAPLAGVADLSGLSPITIVALRNLFKLQSFMEKNNVGGGRYIESILAHWAERVPDFTVQRPQYIRATSIPVQISEVTATANSAGVNSIVGDQAGRAKTQGNLGSVRIYTQEPSLIFGLYCVTAPGAYAGQGIPRMFQHITRYDEPWPDFQHIGEQAIKTRELYLDFRNPDTNDLDFGYQQRYSEYKFMPDRVVGDFQTSLSFWHMARMFAEKPYLNDDFVTQHLDPRIFAVQGPRPVTASFYFDARAKRKLSKYSTPKMS